MTRKSKDFPEEKPKLYRVVRGIEYTGERHEPGAVDALVEWPPAVIAAWLKSGVIVEVEHGTTR